MSFLSPSVSIEVAGQKSVSTERYGLLLLQSERSAKTLPDDCTLIIGPVGAEVGER